VKPIYAVDENPKNKHTCKYENNLNAFAYKLITYVIKQNIIAFKPKYESVIRSISKPTENASIPSIFLSDLYT